MRIDDLIILGRTEPQETKTSGIVVCTAGYSHELKQFMRIYPLSWGYNQLPRWSIITAELKRNNKDSRRESWRISCDKDEDSYSKIDVISKAIKDNEFCYLKGLSLTIDELNATKSSLGILNPTSKISVTFKQSNTAENKNQASLFEVEKAKCPIAKNFVQPRLLFNTGDRFNNLRLDDWGSYELIRKNPENIDILESALRLNDEKYEHLLFVGNLNALRNVWIVISVISKKKEINNDLFSN